MNATAVKDELSRYRDKVGVPAVIGAVTNADELEAIDVVGMRSRDDDTPATVDDAWHIGSCGKSLSALLYARLVESGRAQWGVPIASFFDDLTGLHPGWMDSTIDELLRCRAGVRANPTGAEMSDSHSTSLSAVDERSAATERTLSDPPKKHGEFVYSNLGYMVAGAAIDRLAEALFEDVLRTEILDPLGITSAGIGPPPLIRGHHSRLSLPGITAGRGRPAIPGDSKFADNPSLLTPAGRLHLSVPDWAKVLRVFLNNGAPLVSPETIEHLLADPDANGKGRSMSMGWADGATMGVTHGMQGSNTLWAATALLDRVNGRAALCVANDGRTRVLMSQPQLAKQLLDLA